MINPQSASTFKLKIDGPPPLSSPLLLTPPPHVPPTLPPPLLPEHIPLITPLPSPSDSLSDKYDDVVVEYN